MSKDVQVYCICSKLYATIHFHQINIPFESETLSVTGVAVNIFVWPVASDPGVQKSRADPAFEASFVPDPVFGEDLVSVVDVASTTRASLSVRSLDHVVFVFDVTVAVPGIPNEKPEVKGGKVYRKKLLSVLNLPGLPALQPMLLHNTLLE